MHPKRLLLFTLIISFAVVLAGCSGTAGENHALKSSVDKSDGLMIFNLLLKEPRFKEVADRVAPFTVRVEVTTPYSWDDSVRPGRQTFDYAYAADNVTNVTSVDPDFTLKTSRDVALAVLNADDGFRVFACAMNDDAATFEATNLAYAASFNGAKGRIVESASDCTAEVGDNVTFRGLTGALMDGNKLTYASTGGQAMAYKDSPLPPLVARMGDAGHDLLVFNQWRAPTAWIANDNNQYCISMKALFEDKVTKDICAGAGTSVPSSDLATCAEKVKTAYKDDDEKAQAEGWGAGHVAARAADKAAEEALCQLVFGGV